MKLSETAQLSETELQRVAFDIFIAASGYEARSSHLLKYIRVNDISIKAAFGFKDRKVEQRENNDLLFSHVGVGVILVDGDSSAGIKAWLESALKQCDKDVVHILIDYSSMTRTWYASIIESILCAQRKKRVECYFSYSPAKFTPPSPPSSNASVGPIPRFCSLGIPDKPTALIVGLGYEDERALGLVEYIDPAITCAFFVDPALDQSFVNTVLTNNETLLKCLPKERIYPHPLCDLQRTGDILSSVCAGLHDDYRIILAPLGVKPFSLLCLLLATLLPDIDVWRVTSGMKATPKNREAAGPILTLKASFQLDASLILT